MKLPFSDEIVNKNLSVSFDTTENSKKINYEFTSNPDFLNQYYKIREDCYRDDLGLTCFSGEEDEYDRIGYIAVARIGDKVIGGARLILSHPHSGIRLTLEEENFLMVNFFPELDLEENGYCEITRVAILREYRNTNISKDLFRVIMDRAKSEKCYFHFSTAPLIQARNYKIIAKKLGFISVIRNDIVIPYKQIYDNLKEHKICLAVTYLMPTMLRSNDSNNIKLYEVIMSS